VVSVPSAILPSPIGHARQATHAIVPTAVLKVPYGHDAHFLSDDAVGSTVSYWPAWHTVMTLHPRSDEPVGAVEVYCSSGQTARSVAHSRFDTALGSLVSHSSFVHCSTGAHGWPSLAAEYELIWHAAHWRSATALPAID
jgi:hypothetical protein